MQVDHHNLHGLLHSAGLVETELRRQLAPLGIQPRQAQIIDTMSRTGPISQADLVSARGGTSASMSTMTDRLLAAGYITRTVNPESRRQNILSLTDKGRELLADISKAWAAVDDAIFKVLDDDAAVFFELARKLRDGLGGEIPGAPTSPK